MPSKIASFQLYVEGHHGFNLSLRLGHGWLQSKDSVGKSNNVLGPAVVLEYVVALNVKE